MRFSVSHGFYKSNEVFSSSKQVGLILDSEAGETMGLERISGCIELRSSLTRSLKNRHTYETVVAFEFRWLSRNLLGG